MPPKKEVKQEKVLLGRPGNNLKSGIVCETCQFPAFFVFLPFFPACFVRESWPLFREGEKRSRKKIFFSFKIPCLVRVHSTDACMIRSV
jgi:hypothetical protein